MSSDIKDSDVEALRILAMKALMQQTQNDETVGVNRHLVFEKAVKMLANLSDKDNMILPD